jgi:hypothetical protein
VLKITEQIESASIAFYNKMSQLSPDEHCSWDELSGEDQEIFRQSILAALPFLPGVFASAVESIAALGWPRDRAEKIVSILAELRQ